MRVSAAHLKDANQVRIGRRLVTKHASCVAVTPQMLNQNEEVFLFRIVDLKTWERQRGSQTEEQTEGVCE